MASQSRHITDFDNSSGTEKKFSSIFRNISVARRNLFCVLGKGVAFPRKCIEAYFAEEYLGGTKEYCDFSISGPILGLPGQILRFEVFSMT